MRGKGNGAPSLLKHSFFGLDHIKEQSRGNVDNRSSLSGVFEIPLMSPWLVL